MKLIRQIIIGLAFISALICVSVISVSEYSADKIDESATEDKLPIVKNALSFVGPLLENADKIPSLNLLPAAKVGADYEIGAALDIYDKAKNITPDDLNVSAQTSLNLANTANDSLKNVDFKEIFNRIQEILSKGLFRFLK